MTPAVITFTFDPVVRLGDLGARLEIVALAVVILVALLLAARIAVVERRRAAAVPTAVFGPPDAIDLRLDDLLLLALGAVPGAVIGGRLGNVLGSIDFYAADPARILDPAVGGLSLGLAVLAGIGSAAYVARLLDAPIAAWAHVAALPVPLALAAGKLALVLGGSGQGAPADLGWATAYAGAGPWGSPGPEVPSHPVQVYEALTTLATLGVVMLALQLGAFGRRDGSALVVAIGLWAVGRAIVGVAWREPPLVGPLRAEQLIAVGIVVGCVATSAVVRLRWRSAGPAGVGSSQAGPRVPEWPDPATRPRF